MPASAEDLKARVRRAQRRARRERARKKALLGPGWQIARDTQKTEGLRQALNRPGGPGGGGWGDPEIAGILLAQEKLRKAAEIERKAKERPLTADEYHEHERLVREAKRERNRVADTGKAPWEELIEVLAGPATASWLPGGTPRHGSWKDFAIEGGLAAAGVVPVGKVAGLGVRGARAAAGIPVRTLSAAGFEAQIPHFQSRLGRFVVDQVDKARPESWTLKKISDAYNRQAKMAASLNTSEGKAAQATGRKLKAAENYAIMVANESVPVAVRVARHKEWQAAARAAGRADEAAAHGIHLRMLDRAARYLDESAGAPVIKASASARLREARRLSKAASDTGTGMKVDLGLITKETAAARPSKPGRVYLGAEWYSRSDAAKDILDLRRSYRGVLERAEKQANASIRAMKREAKEAGYREVAAAKKAERLIGPSRWDEGRIRAELVKIHAAHGAKGAYAAEAKRLAAAADDELAKIATARQGAIDAIRSKAGSLRGAEDFTGGQFYMETVRGIPGLQGARFKNLARAAMYMARGGWRRRAASTLPRDQSVVHEWTGAVMRSGLFRTDVPTLVGESLARASKLVAAREWHRILATAGSDIPRSLDDIPVAVTMGRKVSPQLQAVWDKWEMIKAGGLGRAQWRALDRDKEITDLVQQVLFPSEVTHPGITRAAVEGAKVPGIVWVPREILHASDPFKVAGRYRDYQFTTAIKGKRFSLDPLAPVDLAVDYTKAAVLFGNPAYAPVQFMQNLVLVGMEGGLTPAKAARAARLLGKVSPENREFLLTAVQAGHASVLRPTTRMPIDTAARVAMMFADRFPRAISLVNAGAKAGVRTPAEWDALINAARAGKKDAFQKLFLVMESAVDAVGDFERMGTFEKNVLARWLFVYPWIKAAWRLSYKKTLDHPWQSAALGYGAYELKERSDRMLGDRPPWAMFEIPIPGQYDENGNPITVNIANWLPYDTVADVGKAAINTVTGKLSREETLHDLLQPSVQSAITAITGRDRYGREVGTGLPTFIKESWKETPWSRFAEGFSMPEEEKREKMFPRDTEDELIRVGAGSLAPKPYNIEKAQAIAQGKTRTSGSYVRQAMREATRFVNANPDLVPKEALPAIEQALTLRARVSDKQFEMRREQKVKDLTDRQEYAAKLSVLQELRPELGIDNEWWDAFRTLFETAPADARDKYKTFLNGLLELEDVYQVRVLSFLSTQRSKARDIERAKRIAGVN